MPAQAGIQGPLTLSKVEGKGMSEGASLPQNSGMLSAAVERKGVA